MSKNESELFTQAVGAVNLMEDRELIKKVMLIARSKYEELALHQPWKEGAKVQMLPEHQSSKPYNMVGVIKKVNITKCKVKFGETTWNIPKTMMQLV